MYVAASDLPASPFSDDSDAVPDLASDSSSDESVDTPEVC